MKLLKNLNPNRVLLLIKEPLKNLRDFKLGD